MISILIPTLGRAGRIPDILENVKQTTTTPYEVVFIYEESDTASKEAACRRMAGVPNRHSPSYAGAIQTGLNNSIGRYLFLGADDLRFHRGWDTEALRVMEAVSTTKVVGTNDLWNSFVLDGVHSTHSLVDRSYITEQGGVVDAGPGSVLYGGYKHNFVDTEFIATAKMRAVFSPCLTSVVEHLHWTAGKSPHDETYGKQAGSFNQDQDIYLSRQHLWLAISR